MTSLLKQIKKDQLQARKNKNGPTAKSLTTLIGEAEMIGKNDGNRESTDEEVIAVIKKFVKNLKDLMSVMSQRLSPTFTAAQAELDLLSTYLPSQMEEAELRTVIQSHLVELEDISPRMMGQVMKWLKDNYGGQYDGKLASKVVKDLLNG